MRSDMEEWKQVRQQVLANGMIKRAACAKYKLGWHTLNKILAHAKPPGYRQQAARPKRVLASVLPIIHEILATDGKALKKQRHMAKRIFERLKLEYGYLGGKTVVAGCLAVSVENSFDLIQRDRVTPSIIKPCRLARRMGGDDQPNNGPHRTITLASAMIRIHQLDAWTWYNSTNQPMVASRHRVPISIPFKQAF